MATMVVPLSEAASARLPTGPGFDLLLVAHVAIVVAALAVFAIGAVCGTRGCAPGGGEAPSVRRYFAQATGRTGRVLYAVPASGAILVGASGGRFSWLDPWLLAAASLWLVATAVFELVAAPAERRTAALLDTAVSGCAPAAVDSIPAKAFRDSCRTVAIAEGFVVAVLVAAAAVMTAKP